ncbi:GntR family transcriptional regulator [Microbacterium sp. LWS13-1.2]|uniref:GntR family transcriptional regulator n=1 Tax=Microbacterium sp. LWS13-1.2 TaxID=3135264 RepID=A0AAU6SBC0_9MICO
MVIVTGALVLEESATLRGSALVDAIRDLVVRGELAPGSRITEPQLATRFGVSRVPVREALRGLAVEGLIDLRPYGSPTVTRLNDDVIREVRSVRSILEPPAAREAALHRTDADLAEIDAILSQGDDVLARGELAELHRLNSRFHDAVASACGNEVVKSFIHVLSSRSEWINTAAMSRDDKHLWHEHFEIRSAIAARDAPLAEALMAAHIRRATADDLSVADSSWGVSRAIASPN